MKNTATMFRSNRKIATAIWGDLPALALRNLRNMTERHALSIAAGDFQFFDGRLYVTHTGLLHVALRNKCAGIHASLEEAVSEASENRWIFKATVYKSLRSRGFVGFGDADPSNVSPLVHGAEMRVAETRAVNRLSERHTESDSAVSKNSDRSRVRKSLSRISRIQMVIAGRTVQATVDRDCVTNSAFSSAGTTSTPRS